MLLVGLTGGLACGKSFVGHALANLGAHLIQADELGHEVLLPEGEAYEPVLRLFSNAILDKQARIDRRKLGGMVFGSAEKLAALSGIVHPAVERRQKTIVERIAAEDPRAIVVVEAAILVETGSYTKFDRLIVVVCELEQQVERAMKRDALTREEVMARLARQLPQAEKKRLANYIIDTSGAKEATLEQTREVYRSLRSLEK